MEGVPIKILGRATLKMYFSCNNKYYKKMEIKRGISILISSRKDNKVAISASNDHL